MNRRLLTQLCIGLCLLISSAEAHGGEPLKAAPWPATDGLGRTLPHAGETGPPRHDRFVGIFYFLWHDKSPSNKAIGGGPSDIARILAREPGAINKPNSPFWGPLGSPHYWGEPLYGYYRSDDSWVLRRHAYALADAGVDVLIFDTTNAVTYPHAYGKLCEVFQELRRLGETTPQIAFMVNSHAGETADRIYQDLYKPGRFRELWFPWQGKPLLICDPAKASPEVREFFTLRRAHWPFTMVNTDRAWHWEAAYPQPFGYVDDPATPEMVNVSVAQNLRKNDAQVTNMSDGDARGRSFHEGQTDPSPGAINHGYNFQEQWRRAYELDPPFVMITGWNEWIAGRFQRPNKPVVFVDQYDQEHSRDIEFARHGHHDNYYYQMVANIRRFKGTPRLADAETALTIDIGGDFNQWRNVKAEYRDHIEETTPRDHPNVVGKQLRNNSGRNDLLTCKVASDKGSLYFYLRTREPLRPSMAPQQLWLLIDADRSRATGWEGYDFIVGRHDDGSGRMWIEKHVEQWRWEPIVPVPFRQAGSELHLAIPRAMLEPSIGEALLVDFKWADNLQQNGAIHDFYLNGDVAPEGRFNFRHQLSRAASRAKD